MTKETRKTGKSKHSIFYWIILMVVVAVVVAAIWYIGFREPVEIQEQSDRSVLEEQAEGPISDNDIKSEEQAENDELEGWNIYTSAEHGYSFKYPTDWNIDSSNGSGVVVSKYYTNDRGFEDGGTFVVDVYQNTGNKTLDEWIAVNDPVNEETMTLISTEEKTLAGIAGEYRVATSGIAGGYINSLTVLYQGYVYRVGLNTRILAEAADTQAEFDKTLDNMLGSFKFGE